MSHKIFQTQKGVNFTFPKTYPYMSLSKDTNNLVVSAVCKIFHRTPRFKAPANTVQGVNSRGLAKTIASCLAITQYYISDQRFVLAPVATAGTLHYKVNTCQGIGSACAFLGNTKLGLATILATFQGRAQGAEDLHGEVVYESIKAAANDVVCV